MIADDVDRTSLIAPTVQALSERHGGLPVILLTVDGAAATATVEALHDPDPDGHHALNQLSGVSIPLAGTICGLVCATGTAIEIGDQIAANPPLEMLPEGWLRYARHFAIRGAVVHPVRQGTVVAGLLVTGRRNRDPFDAETLAALDESAGRLGTLLPAATPSPDSEPAVDSDRLDARRDLSKLVDVALGLIPAIALACVAATSDNPNDIRPTSIVVLATTALGALRNRLAAAVSAVAGLVVIWWWFSKPYGSLKLPSSSDGLGVVITALTLIGVQIVLHQVDQSRRRRAEEAAIVDAVITRLPLGFGLLDTDRRFQRVNERLAQLDGASVADHIDRRPGDVNPLTGELYEHLVAQVLDTGEAVVDEVVSFDLAETGLTHSWRINEFPVELDGRTVGVGTTIEDITEEVIVRHRAQLMLQLSRTVAGAASVEQIADHVVTVMADGLKARSMFATVHDGLVRVESVSGYRDERARGEWLDFTTPLDGHTDLVTCLDAAELVIRSIDGRGSDPERELHRAVDNVTVVWQPVSRPGDDVPTAAIGVAWPFPRRLTEHSRTLLQTAASFTGLAMARIALTEQAERDRFRTAMDAMTDQVILAHSVRDREDRIVDFEVDFANATARTSPDGTSLDLVGTRVGTLFPRWAESGLFNQFCQVVETGVPWVVDRLAYRDLGTDGTVVEGFWNLQVVKVDDGYIAASKDVTEVVEAERLAGEARELAQRERVAVDLLQRAALPGLLPKLHRVDLTAHYRAAAAHQPVGGDWYDAFALDPNTLALVIADVAGHGPEAAGTMVQVRNILRALAKAGEDPGQVLSRVDEVVQRMSDRGGPFVTCCYATLDATTGDLRWASAGHLPPIISRKGGEVELMAQTPGPPLASLVSRSYPVSSTRLGDGDLLVLYTDGLVERRGEVIDEGLDRLRDQVSKRPESVCEAIAKYLAEGIEDPPDDTAILCASYHLS